MSQPILWSLPKLHSIGNRHTYFNSIQFPMLPEDSKMPRKSGCWRALLLQSSVVKIPTSPVKVVVGSFLPRIAMVHLATAVWS